LFELTKPKSDLACLRFRVESWVRMVVSVSAHFSLGLFAIRNELILIIDAQLLSRDLPQAVPLALLNQLNGYQDKQRLLLIQPAVAGFVRRSDNAMREKKP
jgi:hypothetical protein